MKPLLIYCFDAYCGWCYGFSPVITRIASEYKNIIPVEVLSGGMVLPYQPVPIIVTSSYIQKSYKTIQELTGVEFGKDYLWHIFHPNESDWFPDSEKPAIALCIFKEIYPDQQVEFGTDLQYALHYEGRDLTDDEAYRHLLKKYKVPEEDFYYKLKQQEYKDKAHNEFSLVKQLKVTGFPSLLIQENESKFHLVGRGYTEYETLNRNIQSVIQSFTTDSSSS